MKLLLPGPLLRAELITSGIHPVGGFHRTTAVLGLGLYLDIMDSGKMLFVDLKDFNSWWILNLSWGTFTLLGSLRVLWGGKVYSSQLELLVIAA